MAKSLSLGNGNILVCMDKRAQVRDFYFPYVGLENHIGGHFTHRVGVFANNQLNWFDHSNWDIKVHAADQSMIGETVAKNAHLGVTLNFSDTVYNEKNIFLREVVVTNDSNETREIKLFFGHEFEIYESHRGDTSYFDPIHHTLVHYNGKRVFLVNGLSHKGSFDDYTAGIFKIEGKEGSFKDAEDGMLSKNLIEHGPSDSVIGFYLEIPAHESKTIHYWVAAGESIKETLALNAYVLEKSPSHIIKTTRDYWHAWVNKYNFTFYGLKKEEISLFKRSLLTIRTHADNRGAIIASADSDMQQNGRDTYSYMWPRDGALSAMAFDMAGDFNVAERFFDFCDHVITDDGYFMHKYRPDESLGSSWHPWMRNGKIELPIQEDETALILIALWNHYAESKDLEFVEKVYNSLVKRAADFMVGYREPTTRLPKASYDLWEEKFGIHTYTAASVYSALTVAAKFAKLLGKERSEHIYTTAAFEIRQAILNYLYDEEAGYFIKMINVADDGSITYDRTLDMSSVYGIFAFGVLDASDQRVARAIKQVEERILVKTAVGGIARYEGDVYFKSTHGGPGNPWIITSLWLAQYYIELAKKDADFAPVHQWLEWASRHTTASGIFSEQLNPETGEPISATPLTWSHSEYIMTVLKYLNRLEELGICLKCNPLYASE
ncbi:MAG: glycoside hydrolase family 15 protein [Candidatus Pacebacteria bacterium]|jgi:oligosaccharide amylase|nr:glycoside hydrolase family 15 protein [Candidatus Paceibacterota bacterium]